VVGCLGVAIFGWWRPNTGGGPGTELPS
jgi:hypothetical protein